MVMKLSDEFGQEVEFDIAPELNKIAVNCSGGADSSILLYVVCDYIKKQNRKDARVSVLTCGNALKDRWNPRKAADVVNYVAESLDFDQFDMHYSYYRDLQAVNYFHEIERKLFEDNRTEIVISGITANPIVEAIVENSNGEMVNLADEALPARNAGGNTIYEETSWGGKFYTPFSNVDKRFIASMYRQYNVEPLFDLTRSCEAIPDSDKPFDPNFENTPCGNCWWCLERKWAFGRL
jgi:tRNA(Ile)-lysidine synthase TilS/MesJ